MVIYAILIDVKLMTLSPDFMKFHMIYLIRRRLFTIFLKRLILFVR